VRELVVLLGACGRLGFDAAPVASGDVTFGSGGSAHIVVDQGAAADVLAIDHEGRIVVAGSASMDNLQGNWIARLDATGANDVAFGVVRPDGDGNAAHALAIDEADRIVMFGWVPVPGQRDIEIARVLPDATRDAAFGTNGEVAPTITCQAAAGVVSGNREIAMGGDGSDWLLAAYDGSGRIDTTFGTAGLVHTSVTPGNDGASAAVIDAAGRIWVAGLAGTAQTSFAVARYDASGTLDTTWGTAGLVTSDVAPGDDTPTAIVVDGSSVVVVGFSFQGEWEMQRFRDPGVADPAIVLPLTGGASTVAIDRDRGVFVGGGDGARLVHVLADGTFDPAFGGDGGRALVPDEPDAALSSCVMDAAERLVCAGRDSIGALVVRLDY
jgi:uncharacterized delta-60 repeat protein